MDQTHIRNFCIIAHIDHGKSTLADRLLEFTHTVEMRDMQAQLLDSNPIERERGITIKLAPVRMMYVPTRHPHESEDPDSRFRGNDKKEEFILNLIDTPGHVDFNYEVSRSLAACEGAVLVVDATQGVQAQTLANLNLARKQNLTIIPVINKIDLPNAQIEKTLAELSSLGFRKEEVISISAKNGTNIDKVLEAIVKLVPEPKGSINSPLRALIFSSQYDTHKGVVVYVRVVDGSLYAGPVARVSRTSRILPANSGGASTYDSVREPLTRTTRIQFMANSIEIEPIEVGYFMPQMKESGWLFTGEVGYIATGLKDVALAKVGDTITVTRDRRNVIRNDKNLSHVTSHVSPLVGYKEPKPMVFLGLYPLESDKINEVRDALGKLRLSDSAFSYKPISSLALGHGFHCGFLGLLHAEVVQERLSREFNLNLLATAPTVEYRIKLKGKGGVISNLPAGKAVAVRDPIGYTPSAGDFSPEFPTRVRNDNMRTIQSATEYPDPSTIEQTFEPIMELIIFSPKKYVGNIMQLCQDKRAEFIDLQYIGVVNSGSSEAEGLAKFSYLIPLSEMIVDFFDRLKSVTEGYASLDYEFFDYQKVDVVKLDILLNHEKVDAFSQLVVESRAQNMGRMLVEKLAEVIPRQQFNIPVQATIGGQIIARADVKAFRKDVTQKLYGGDRTRKDKLLEAQKKGKKKMKMVGRVEIPQEAFLKVFKSS